MADGGQQTTAETEPALAAAPAIGSGGVPLDERHRASFEGRFGYSFKDVRLHADGMASAQARAMGARAFTLGSHIYFANHADALGTPNQRLLAHELAHVVQQRQQPDLARHALRDDDPHHGLASTYFDVKVTRALDEEGLLIALLEQHFAVPDAETARKIIEDVGLSLGEDFIVPDEDVAKGSYAITIDRDQSLQIEASARKFGVQPTVHDTSTTNVAKKEDDEHKSGGAADHSKELTDALAEHAKLLPGGPTLMKIREDQLPDLLTINAGLQTLTEDERKLYLDIAAPTDDLRAHLEGLRSFVTVVSSAKEILQEEAKTEKQPSQLQQELSDTWKGIDENAWKNMDQAAREALARSIAAKQRNIQLKHMVTHPGETLKGMAKSIVRPDKVAKEVANDIKTVADSSKSTTERAAAAASAGKKVSMWLSAAITVLAVIAFIVAPEVFLQLYLMDALVLMMIGAGLSLAESELRIQQASETDDFAAAQLAVSQAASAQAEFITAVALALIPLAGKIFAKIPFVGKVIGVLGEARKLGAAKFWSARAAIVTKLRAAVSGAEALAENEAAALTSLAKKLEGMTAKEFMEALKSDKALREQLGIEDGKSIEQLEALEKMPNGEEIFDRLRQELARTAAAAKDVVQRMTEDYVQAVEDAATDIENAKTEAEAQEALSDAERALSEQQASKDLKERAEDYKNQRVWEAAEKVRLEELDKQAAKTRAEEAQKAAEQAAADKAAADQAAADAAAKQAAAKKTKAAPKAAKKKPTKAQPKTQTEEKTSGDQPEATTPEVVESADQPLQDVKPEEAPDAAAAEVSADASKRLDWKDAEALDLETPPEGVKSQGLLDLWKQWADYVRARLKAKSSGASARRPLTWEAYRDFLGKFVRGRLFQKKFTKTLEAEVGTKAIVEQDVGVVSETLETRIEAGDEGVKFADQIVTDKAALESYKAGEGPAPEVDTYSNKSRDFAVHDSEGTLRAVVEQDVKEVLTKYGGKITIRRPGPLKGVKVTVREATLVYDAAWLPEKLRDVVRQIVKDTADGAVKLRIE